MSKYSDEILKVVVDAIVKDGIERELGKLAHRCTDALAWWMGDKEDKHGECPAIVKNYVNSEILASIGRYSLIHHELYVQYYTDLPKKGTEVRAAYDHWMRQKRKPTE